MTTGFASGEQFLDHKTRSGHPERPDRIRAIMAHLADVGLADRLTNFDVGGAPLDDVQAVHERAYIERLRRACEQGERYIDVPDSAICEDSFDVAMLAAGYAISAVKAVLTGKVSNAFCAARPPGHHAEADRSMGFCLLNNIAIAAEYLVKKEGVERVAIVDFDVHHGNGTQHIFEKRSDVMFISMHEDPTYLYPGTGFANERGIGPGEGFTLNIPMQPGSGDEAYAKVMDEKVLPALDGFGPQFLLVSAGFDAAAADPLAHMQVTSDGFAGIAKALVGFAESHCEGRHVALLEGGYDLDALAGGVERYLLAMLG